jgi:alpha-tubulin N-acetyltransferase 1
MEFKFDLEDIFYFDENKIVKIDTKDFRKCFKKSAIAEKYGERYFKEVIDKMGEASSSAQKLGKIITCSYKISGTRLYLKIDKNKALGFIKIGEKHLFYRDFMGKIYELEAQTVLDFYVHESEQRKGHGLVIYQSMLKYEAIEPNKLGIDAPSPKFLGFMQKYFKLSKYIKQSSNFVIFDDYFDETFKKKNGVDKQYKNYGFAFRENNRIQKSL